MQRQTRGSCPGWCVADHAADDEGGLVRHRSATSVVPGVALNLAPPHEERAIELLIEVHAQAGDPVVAVYIGDGVDGLDLTLETADRLVTRLGEVLRASRAASGLDAD